MPSDLYIPSSERCAAQICKRQLAVKSEVSFALIRLSTSDYATLRHLSPQSIQIMRIRIRIALYLPRSGLVQNITVRYPGLR